MDKISGCLMWYDLQKVLQEVKTVDGDLAEVGVYKGNLFRKLILFGGLFEKTAHAFDSFEGVDHPSAYDGTRFPKGACNCGGLAMFTELMFQNGYHETCYVTHKGFIPDCFPDINTQYCFVYVDVDHYKPTWDAVDYFHTRIPQGGILGFDDFYYKDDLASKAIHEFMDSDLIKAYRLFLKTDNHQIFFQKQ